MKSCTVYRHFDKEGTLLYVGVSLNAIARLRQHHDYSTWFRQINNVTLESFPSREEALEAEALFIKNEKPLYNKQLNHGGPEEERSILIQDSRVDLERKILERKRRVEFYPVYSIEEVAEILMLKLSDVKRLIDQKVLGHITVPGGINIRFGQKMHIRITGWQLIDYLEYLIQAEDDNDE